MTLRWIADHTGIREDEKADELVKIGSTTSPRISHPISQPHINNQQLKIQNSTKTTGTSIHPGTPKQVFAATPQKLSKTLKSLLSPMKRTTEQQSSMSLSRGVHVKRQNGNKSLPCKAYFPDGLTQNDHGFRCSLAQIKNRYPLSGLFSRENFQNSLRMDKLFDAHRPY